MRWKEQASQINAELEVILGNVFLSGLSICFFGPYSGLIRDQIQADVIEQCKAIGIPHSKEYQLQLIMGNSVEIRDWMLKGLSSDTISINNGILVRNSDKFPLIIDPQNQAFRWIKSLEAENNIQISKLSQEGFQRALEENI